MKAKNKFKIILLLISTIFNSVLADEFEKKIAQLPILEQREIVEKILWREIDRKSKHKRFLQPHAADELNLIVGKLDTPDMSLLKHINKTSTLYGYQVLGEMLLNPLSNIDYIVQNPGTIPSSILERQLFIESLVNHSEELNAYKALLEEIGKHQSNVLLLWSENNPFSKKKDILYSEVQVMGWDRSKLKTEMVRWINNFMGAVIPAVGFCLTLQGLRKIVDTKSQYEFNKMELFKAGGGISIFLFSFYKIFPGLINQEKTNKNLQELLSSIALTVNKAKEIHFKLSSNSTATKVLKYFPALQNIFEKNEARLIRINNLINQLSSRTFRSDPSFFSYMGRVRVIYNELLEIRDELIPMLKAIGEFDAYISMALALQDSVNKKLKFCFTKFVSNDHPRLEIENGWNPVITNEKTSIISESIKFGPGDIRNMLLTGPHGGGKSTFMKMLAYCVILSQTFGVAPASACTMTVFSHINTYLDIRDNMEQGMSTFMAEHERVTKIKKRIRGSHEGEFSLTLMDEVFKGTMQSEASKLIIKFSNKISQVGENICVMATHFNEPSIELEKCKDATFANYHMETQEKAPGRFKRTFKLIKGRNEWWFNDSAKRDRYIKWLQSVA